VARALIVDDDTELCELVEEYLGQDADAPDAAVEGEVDIVILDVMLPGLNGFEVLRKIRERSEVPVIMLTARGEDVDRIVGLELGADDYLPKPFNPRELAARMRAVLRRVERPRDTGKPELLEVGDLSLDLGARVARRGGEELRLTGIEFALLEVLVRGAGTVVERDDLSRQVLGRRASSFDRALDVHLSNLRKKLGPLVEGSERIKTIRGVGYLYVRPAV
jgi:two-component system response regulator CpxR